MKKLINIITKAIDCPLMDTHNIPFEIAGYLTHKIFYLYCSYKSQEWRTVTTRGYLLATTPEHAWELYEEHTKNIPNEYILKKDDFMMNLWYYGDDSYISTNGGTVRYLRIEWFDETDDIHSIECEYKKPTRNVIRKEIAKTGKRAMFIFGKPMIDAMMDGVIYEYI